jgi:ERF superfamily
LMCSAQSRAMLQHASASIGAIAAALAKAQAELLNPEKSLTGTLPSPSPHRPERTFRYAPLSSGLDIIRKSLGRHEIATIQTTEIDEGGLIHLKTVLAHASGEWISSDWPVCPVSEIAASHRLGAALTYARRHSLFTLVGIAGEDDLDAPDLPLSDSRPSHPNGSPTQTNGMTNRTVSRRPVPVLAPDQSAARRQELERELSGLASAEELTAWASRALDLKSSLGVEHAAELEQAFARRMSTLQISDQAEGDGADLTAIAPRARQRIKANGAPVVITPLHKTPRRRNKKHLQLVALQPCLVCGRTPSDAHHLRFAEPRALGRKVSDEFAVPLCRSHHSALHRAGDERAWWRDVQIDPTPIAEQLWRETREPLP